MKEVSKNPPAHPLVVERVNHSHKWKLVALMIFLPALVFLWPVLNAFFSHQTTPTRQPDASQTATRNRPVTFDEVLDAALMHERKGQREKAHAVFHALLKQSLGKSEYDKQAADLLPRAAHFYSQGTEIPALQVENLYLDALDAIQHVHGENYYDYEHVYMGLEKHYLSLNRYREAARLTRLLLNFYQRKYQDNEDTLYLFITPTTIRLGHNLLAAGQNGEARVAYQKVLKSAREHGRPVAGILEFINATYKQAEVIPPTDQTPLRAPASLGASVPSASKTEDSGQN